jgi:hypothetical protein
MPNVLSPPLSMRLREPPTFIPPLSIDCVPTSEVKSLANISERQIEAPPVISWTKLFRLFFLEIL